ncbi:MAG: hypothetical protein CL912_29580 [Deltaproteobacteria bacterium]|nr:hypothetical protein [Deltaproteobacteria bacterium]|tara:strand:+ start:437 stop:1027 length:591 start_codon:yes stop_codon:yes gene_type:complete
MFSYPDAARYRLGVNYQQLPTNLPISAVYAPMQRDGFANFRGNYGPDPNYVRSTLRPLNYGPAKASHDEWIGKISEFSSEVTDEDFVQPKGMWDVFARYPDQQENFVHNVAVHLGLAVPEVQQKAIGILLMCLGIVNSVLTIVQKCLLALTKTWVGGSKKRLPSFESTRCVRQLAEDNVSFLACQHMVDCLLFVVQ